MKKIILISLLSVILIPQIVSAQGNIAPCGQIPPIGFGQFDNLLKRICDVVFALAYLAIFIFFALAGFYFLKAKGDPDQLNTARQFLIWAIVGTVVIFSVTIIIAFANWLV